MSKINNDDLKQLLNFLRVQTPQMWLEKANENLPTLLIDHAHCERKAALNALQLISKYPQQTSLIEVMSPLAREELLHFEKVMQFIRDRNIAFRAIKPSNYSAILHNAVSSESNKARLRDQLIIGAIIEARSCERFLGLANVLKDDKLVRFFKNLVHSEARHFQSYLELANKTCDSVLKRVSLFLDLENHYILSKDTVFRFHSGIPN